MFHDDCKMAKQHARFSLDVFKRTGTHDDRLAYVAARKAYKNLIRTKKTSYKRDKARRLASFGKDSRAFWKELRQVSGRIKSVISDSIILQRTNRMIISKTCLIRIT